MTGMSELELRCTECLRTSNHRRAYVYMYLAGVCSACMKMALARCHSLHKNAAKSSLKLATLDTRTTHLDYNIISTDLILKDSVGREVANFVKTPLDALYSLVLHNCLPLLLRERRRPQPFHTVQELIPDGF